MIKKIYHFLGSVYFALPLIASFALFVIIGTFLESKFDSHMLASHYTYSHPAFSMLLALFFVNILLATLRRYPFKLTQWPFLLTHLGLLMVIAGTLIKNIAGVQGEMQLVEGSGGTTLHLPQTETVRIEKRGSVGFFDLKTRKSPFDELQIELLGYAPNSRTEWISFNFPKKMKAKLLPDPYPPYNIYREKVDNPKYPALMFDNDEIIAIDDEGRTTTINEALIAYDKGFLGYTKEISIPIQTGKQKAAFWLKTLLKDDPELNNWPLKLPENGRQDAVFAHLLQAGNLLPQQDSPDIKLEFPLKRAVYPEKTVPKWEENSPLVKLRLKTAEQEEEIVLPFDKTERELSWPVLNGTYLIKYQRKEKTLPHNLRLRAARQKYFSGTTHPESYEADLWIDDILPVTLSMNQVHETDDGYRLYLSTISTSENRAAKAGLVINKDPARYRLTYPGALFLVIGALTLLFRTPALRRPSQA